MGPWVTAIIWRSFFICLEESYHTYEVPREFLAALVVISPCSNEP